MVCVTRADVLARIERERKASNGAKCAVAFDGDGTLWSGDIGEDFFHAIVERGDFRPPALERMREEATAFSIAPDDDGQTIARRIYAAYKEERFPEERVCELMAWGTAGWSRRELEKFVADLVQRERLRARLHPEVVAVVEWARGAGLEVFLVSASPRAVIEESAKLVGVAPEHVVAATPMWNGDVMLADVHRPIPYGPGKVDGLRRVLDGQALVAAFGDNAFDVPMLQQARVPIAVRPKERLRARASEVAALVELAVET
jgi:phosphoserine phosphatase